MLLKDYLPNINKKFKNLNFSGLAFNSKEVKKNYIFIAIKGDRFDGNNYINDAIKNGAKKVVLFGISGGGGPEASWIMNTNEPEKVDGFIYEAPTFNFIESVKVNGQARFPWLPVSLFDYFIWLSEIRFGIDFDSMDYREAVINDDTPMLLFHGDDDEWIPVSLSDYIAEKRTTNIQYLRYENVGHVQAWNADPELYIKTVSNFLTSLEK